MNRPRFRETHSSVINGKRHYWNTERLWVLSARLPVIEVDPQSIKELDEDCWFGDQKPTINRVIDHARRIQAASLDFPIILNYNGALMDGGHRLAKAIMLGNKTVKAVRFPQLPEPDYVEP